ncbi:HTH-type transcriptional repressor PurR [Thermoclostridium stercorarium subsp. stercorarium DSM 8532]|jgi:LacI family transcriptional regulator|uniref:HTH-type transcriptional repressor PurR n=3 Tax=Thermoclostridium stercorarium TaxID=1510 RepID=L7VLM3_THES1|nr:LacI family DNA-binding transcriptional regulator [Thermoclostridium stercorarium]AGC67401.1 HTH-type transcriptional repressor PurR [Thermoclostridium stercorarium subsp. stercorarium DSM 8532]AGI38462.1 transcriptional regulator [Thermoclostridium stercorarium subsp. stercorarium DSM 8532]ANW97892.1 transcriptional regulator [Thermoclostridium stercorarium subsp. thermolacticum DSM 2910]ANX00443.1 transcriptional regulator [Thermoclostridium stercorarium subsp. leptospartum DSM 9219]UZQ85
MKSEDIARLAGVSRSTVSRVINNYKNVPEETRRKVMQVIERYQFRPNNSARVLAGKKTDTIGLFIVSIAEKDNINRVYRNNYFSPFVDAVIDNANANGIYVLVNSIYSLQDYEKIKRAFLERRIDAGIVVGTEKEIDVIAQVASMGYPFSIIDYSPEEIVRKIKKGKVAVINSTDDEGTRKMLEYLIGLGHKEIGILSGRMNTYSGRIRYDTYLKVLAEHGIETRKEWVLKGEFIKKEAANEVMKMINHGKLPTALFCCNDDMALSAIEVFRNEKIRIPEDISVAGFDDIMPASLVKPALTTVRVPLYSMARKAVEEVLKMLGETSDNISIHSLETELIVRDSCTAVSGAGITNDSFTA